MSEMAEYKISDDAIWDFFQENQSHSLYFRILATMFDSRLFLHQHLHIILV